MRRMTLWLAMMALVSGGALAAIACGGDDAAPAAAKPDAATSTSSGGSSSSSGTDPGTSSSSGGPTDAGGSSSGTLVSNPVRITCGAVECDAGGFGGGTGGGIGGFCCERDGGTNPVCLRNNQTNQCDNSVAGNSLQLSCDESADCPTFTGGAGQTIQQKCCLSRIGDVGTACQVNCTNGHMQICKTDAECSDGGAAQPTCSEKTCRGFKVHVCGTPDNCQ